MQSRRRERVRELLKRELSLIVLREFAGPDSGLVTINDVALSGDLHSATVYVSIVGDAEQQRRGIARLRRHRKRIQGMVGSSVVLRYTPQLRFVVDDSVIRGDRVLQIMEEIERTLPPEPA